MATPLITPIEELHPDSALTCFHPGITRFCFPSPLCSCNVHFPPCALWGGIPPWAGGTLSLHGFLLLSSSLLLSMANPTVAVLLLHFILCSEVSAGLGSRAAWKAPLKATLPTPFCHLSAHSYSALPFFSSSAELRRFVLVKQPMQNSLFRILPGAVSSAQWGTAGTALR